MSTPTLDKQPSDGHSAALDAAESAASHLITVTLRIRRFNRWGRVVSQPSTSAARSRAVTDMRRRYTRRGRWRRRYE